jgi:hypothetical protein
MFSGKLYKNVFNFLPIKKIAENLKTIDNTETFIYENDNTTVEVYLLHIGLILH